MELDVASTEIVFLVHQSAHPVRTREPVGELCFTNLDKLAKVVAVILRTHCVSWRPVTRYGALEYDSTTSNLSCRCDLSTADGDRHSLRAFRRADGLGHQYHDYSIGLIHRAPALLRRCRMTDFERVDKEMAGNPDRCH